MSFKVLSSSLDLVHSILAVTKLWAAARSKDPSTKVGACVYDMTTGGMFLGYNGFPAGIADREDWWNNRDPSQGLFTKYDLAVHAEVNAVRKALVCGAKLSESILVVTHHPCIHCTRDLVCTSRFLHVYYESDDLKFVTEEMRKRVATLMNSAGIPLTKITDAK